MSTDYTSSPTLKRRVLSSLAHGAIFFSSLFLSVGVPIALLLIADDPVIRGSAKESINFHLNIWLYGIILGILTWFIIGWLFVPILLIVQIVMPIFAIWASWNEPDQVYRYPFLFRLVK